MNKVKFTVEKTGTGYSAFAILNQITHGIQGTVATTGDNITELRANALEALNGLLIDQGMPEAVDAQGVIDVTDPLAMPEALGTELQGYTFQLTTESRNVKLIGINKEALKLYVLFLNGSQYIYSGVDVKLLQHAATVDSIGTFLHKYIINKHAFERAHGDLLKWE